jgi:UDP-N-acetylglucosamine diphosphorylase/glucosamine-1-phosphate N-acetyltransferase
MTTTTTNSRAPAAVILAAGKGTRMNSDLPKVMHHAFGRPLVEWVVLACREAGVGRIVLVVGHGAEVVRAHFAGQSDIEFVVQSPQLGTGHAVDQSRPLLAAEPARELLVLCGDGPLIRASTLRALLAAHRSAAAAATLATSIIDEPTGYGRIERDAGGHFLRIVEQKDATPAQLAIREVNPSYYCFTAGDLFRTLARVDNKNANGEYYITDTFGLLRDEGRTVAVVDAVPASDVLSVNTPAQLAEVAAILESRTAAGARA